MVVIDGEKYACQSCIKGHRVSGCQHTDRDLQHINPKGRPVKQCDHCRTGRKSKSHHAKCDCGHKKDKAGHKLEDGEQEPDLLFRGPVLSNYSEVNGTGCACHTGSKCVCGTKKDQGLKVETSSMKTKPRLTATQSESTLMTFANGHHKPCHRLNNAHHVAGMPYKIPRPHTLHGPSFSAHHSTESVSNFYGMPTQQRSLDHLAINDRAGESETLDPFLKFGEVSASTLFSDSNSPVDNVIQPQQFSWNPMPSTSYNPFDSLSTSPTGEYIANDNDWAIPSAGLEQPSWSAGDLPLLPENTADPTAQPISHSGESNRASVPGLSTSSSQSEIGDPNFFGDVEYKTLQAPLTEPVWDDALQYRRPRSYRGLSNASTPPDHRQAPTSAPDTQSRGSLDLDFLRRNSPPMAAEFQSNYLSQQQFADPVMGMLPQDKLPATSTSTPFMATDLESQPRSVPLAPLDENSSSLGFFSYSDFAPATFDSTEMPVFHYNDNYS